jgi:cation/acetate symporter
MGFEEAVFPYAYPTLFSMGTNFLFCGYFSVTDKSERAQQEQAAFPAQFLRSQTGS